MPWLIKKELTANVRYMLMGFAFFLLYIFIFAGNGAGLFMLCLTISVYSISTTNMALDERYQIDKLLTTLPIRRRDVVLSKYLLVFVIFALCLILYALLSLAAGAVGYRRIPPLTFLSAMLGLFVASLYSGITIPLCYKFGAQSTRYVGLVLFLAAFALSPLIPKAAGMAALGGLPDGPLGLMLLAGALIVHAASFALSNALYAKKDL
jgi:ABC-type transport system involved in multi-copper enzyme maturation permease subunit